MLAVPETVGSNYMGRSDIGSPSGLSVVRLFALCLCRGMAHSRARNTVIQQYDDDIRTVDDTFSVQNKTGTATEITVGVNDKDPFSVVMVRLSGSC